MTDITRRTFIQLTVLGGAAAAAGCDLQAHSTYDPRLVKAEAGGQYGGYDVRPLPYVNQPDGLQDGVPQYFATACGMCAAGCGLFVRTMGGRAHNAQGSPDHPVSGGKVCSRGVASLQHLYNAGRVRFPLVRSSGQSAAVRTDWDAVLTQTAQTLGGAKGRIALLTDAETIDCQPTLSGLVRQFAKSVGAQMYSYALVDDAPWRMAAQAVYGRNQVPAYRLDEADYVVAFGSDFLDAGPSQVYYSRLFGEFRQGKRRTQGEHGTFVFLGPRMNATAAKADMWLPCAPGMEGLAAQSLLHGDWSACGAIGLTPEQMQEVAAGWKRAGTRAVAIGGGTVLSQANAVQTMTAIESLNAQAGSVCVGFGAPALPIVPPALPFGRQMQTLIHAMSTGRVAALVTIGQVNPAFSLPSNMAFVEAMDKVPFVVSIASYEDETAVRAHAFLPARTFLEDWGDTVPAVVPAGVTMATLRQPVIDPQYITDAPGLEPQEYARDLVPWMDTRGTGDILLDLARRMNAPLPATDMRDAVRRTWSTLGMADMHAPDGGSDAAWTNALAQGGVWKQSAVVPAVGRTVSSASSPTDWQSSLPTNVSSGTQYALHLFAHSFWGDGRHANLGWMQEHPDPMSMAVWNSWVEINMEVAHKLGIRTGDIVQVVSAWDSIYVPALPTPGLHPAVIAMPIGQGHTHYGSAANGRGANPLAILDTSLDAGLFPYNANMVTLKKVRDALPGYNGRETLVLPQDRPGGAEPAAVQDLIHTTAREWQKAKPVTGAPQAEGSIFSRKGTAHTPGKKGAGD